MKNFFVPSLISRICGATWIQSLLESSTKVELIRTMIHSSMKHTRAVSNGCRQEHSLYSDEAVPQFKLYFLGFVFAVDEGTTFFWNMASRSVPRHTVLPTLLATVCCNYSWQP